RASKAARTLVERRESDVARLGDPSDLQREADALGASLHLVARGQARLEVLDWEGTPLAIELDPALPAGENLRRAYARAAKAKRGVEKATRRLDEARARSAELL